MTKRINMWSGPRNVSTAIMYSFAQRGDTKVVDEPFYAHYLIQSQADHPGRTEVLESQPNNSAAVMKNLLSVNQEILFLKNMAHHMMGMDDELNLLMEKFQHLFLIRDPAEMLISLDKSLPNPTLRDTAYQQQLELFEKVKARGSIPLVVDSKELLKNPEVVLSTLCDQLDIPFRDTMLSWNPGPISEDGVWARYWYKKVHTSMGFNPYEPKQIDLPPRLYPLYKKCRPIYNRMLAHAIKAK